MSKEWKDGYLHTMEPETGQLYQIELTNSDTHVGYAEDNRFVNPKGKVILGGTEFMKITRFRELDSVEQANEPPVKKFEYYLHDSKEGTFNYLKDELGFNEEDAEQLRYAFYELTLKCKYTKEHIFITHCEGEELESPVKLYRVGDER